MNNHIEGPILTAYTDGMVSLEESERIQTHLSGCPTCREEMHEMRGLKQRVAAMPVHQAPADLVAKLKKTYMRPSLWNRLSGWANVSWGWRPVGAFAAATFLAAGVWFYSHNTEEEMSLEPLLAAHSRYQAETLVPGGDMMDSNFSAQLAVYYGEKN